jgi:hypothetical protein
VLNVAKKSDGIQAAGVLNLTGDDTGPMQIAGVGNFCKGTVTGVQKWGFKYS